MFLQASHINQLVSELLVPVVYLLLALAACLWCSITCFFKMATLVSLDHVKLFFTNCNSVFGEGCMFSGYLLLLAQSSRVQLALLRGIRPKTIVRKDTSHCSRGPHSPLGQSFHIIWANKSLEDVIFEGWLELVVAPTLQMIPQDCYSGSHSKTKLGSSSKSLEQNCKNDFTQIKENFTTNFMWRGTKRNPICKLFSLKQEAKDMV